MAAAKPLESAPPPWHSVAFILLAGLVFVHELPSLDTIDRVASLETFASSVLDLPFMTPLVIGCIRLSFAAFIFWVTIRRCMGPGVRPMPTYRPPSKLIPTQMHLVGIRSLAPFTLWCWVLLGISFLLSGTIPLLIALDRTDLVHPWHLRLALLSFEISAPCAFLVSTVVKYALWPHALKSKGPVGTAVFRGFYGLVTHNLNVIFVLLEVALIGGLPVEMSHISVSPILGLIYVMFSWLTSNTWSVTKGPQFLYFFLDTTLPGYTPTIALAVLLVVLLTFYAIFSVVDDVLEHLEGGIVTHILGALVAGTAVCRFRD